MRAVCWYGSNDIRVERVPDPELRNPHDAIVRITLTAICGSDLHIYNGHIPGMQKGDILGHEFMGEVVETGAEVKRLKKGDRVVVPFTICCGECYFCRSDLWALCDNTNPNAIVLRKLYGASGAGLFGYSHLYGGYAGGQAEYARVPFADVGPIVIENGIPDERVLFLSDIFPTGYMAAENCNIQPGNVIAVWGCGPVGLFSIRSAFMLGAERVIAIDHIPERMDLARQCGAEVLDYTDSELMSKIREMTGGRGPDACIDAVGMEAHGASLDNLYDYAKQALLMETDRPAVLRRAIMACRKGGIVSIPGVYGGFIDKMPMGAAFGKSLTLKMGQTNAPRYLRPLLSRIQSGEIDPSFVISHRMPLEEAPSAYAIFNKKQDGCTKIVLRP